MIEDEVIAIENRLMAKVYAKRPVVIVAGRGARVYDSAGREYIDCSGGYGSCIVGHAHPKVVASIAEQAARLTSCHGSVYNDARSELLEKLSRIAPEGLSRVFLANSGAEAIECAIKAARKFTGRREIIAMMGGFHGKTLGSLSATWDKKYRQAFEPLVPGFRHVPYGNVEKAREAINDNTAAVLVEPIQGEAGVRVAPDGFLQALREICDQNDVLLIMDEVQTGFGRTGKMFACEHWDITPDILCFSKGVASGLPIGVTMARDDVMSSLKVGEHTSTYGGNPIVCAAASATIDVLIGEKLVDNAAKVGRYFKDELVKLKVVHPIVREVRGLGLMLAMELRFDVLKVLLGALERGVLILEAGLNILRFLPPLVISQAEVDKVIKVLEEVLEVYELERLPAKTVN